MPVRKQPWSRIVIFSTLWIRTLRLREPVGLYASIEWYKWVYNPKLGPQFVILPIELQSLSHLKGLNYNTNKKQQQKHTGPLSAGFRVRITTQARHMGSWPRGDSGKTYLIFSVSFYIQPLHLRLVSVQLGPKKEKQEKKKVSDCSHSDSHFLKVISLNSMSKSQRSDLPWLHSAELVFMFLECCRISFLNGQVMLVVFKSSELS